MTDELSFASGPPDDHDGSMQSILLSTPTMPTTYCLTLQVTTWVPVVTAICLALSFAPGFGGHRRQVFYLRFNVLRLLTPQSVP